MQIRLRPSGGRGEYELAGSHGAIRTADLYGLALWFDFGLELRVPLYATVDDHDGKPRIRLFDRSVHVHAARLLAAVLLLPEPTREIRKTGSTEYVDLRRCAYSSIAVDVVNRTSSSATLRPRIVLAVNAARESMRFDVLDRFEQVQRLWAGAAPASTAPQIALCEHHAACLQQPLNQKRVLLTSLKVIELLEAAGQSSTGFLTAPSEDGSSEPQFLTPAEDDPSNPIQVNREVRKRLVLQADRGVEGRRFSQMVNGAYGFRCAFTGLRLPPLAPGYLPGVDAAHIYPWSRFGSNEITNGICLSKHMHWAFDEGIVKLTCEPLVSTYFIELGTDVAQLAINSGLDLRPFQAFCGPIPDSYLPLNPSLRPSPKAIDLYNALMFPSL